MMDPIPIPISPPSKTQWIGLESGWRENDVIMAGMVTQHCYMLAPTLTERVEMEMEIGVGIGMG
jgi:hypothetical protein